VNNTNHSPSPAKPRKPKKPRVIEAGTSEATRLAVVILEVLAGERSPTDAAQTLSITSPRYYQLETRALKGMVAALEPQPKGKQPSLEGRIARLEQALHASRRDCARQEALVRAAQRSLGIKPTAATDGKLPAKDRAGRRKRRPTVRALKAARAIAAGAGPCEPPMVQQQVPATSTMETCPADPSASAVGAPGSQEGAPR
jgi:hypothetical protein